MENHPHGWRLPTNPWNTRDNGNDLMPVLTTSYPAINTCHNVIASTFEMLKREWRRGSVFFLSFYSLALSPVSVRLTSLLLLPLAIRFNPCLFVGLNAPLDSSLFFDVVSPRCAVDFLFS